MANLTHTAPQARDFSATERKALLRKGIAIIGGSVIDTAAGAVNSYHVSDNGTWRGFLRLELVSMVRSLTESEARILGGMKALA